MIFQDGWGKYQHKSEKELADDIYELTTQHMEEINRMLDEFEGQQIATVVQLDAYEAKRRQQEDELENEEPKREQSDPVVHVQESQQDEAGSAQLTTSECQEQTASVNIEEEELLCTHNVGEGRSLIFT